MFTNLINQIEDTCHHFSLDDGLIKIKLLPYQKIEIQNFKESFEREYICGNFSL